MSNIKQYSFKSVGVKTTSPKQPNPFSNRPIGIKTPMRLGQGSDVIFVMNFNIVDQIRDNLRNLILTNHGERMGLYDFGANLQELTLELASEIFDQEVLIRVNTAVSKYMPYITLETAEIGIDNLTNQDIAKVILRIIYNVESLGITNQALEVKFFIGG